MGPRMGDLQGWGGEQFRQVLECHASSRDGKERRMVDTTWENLGQRETHCTEEGTNQVSTMIRDPKNPWDSDQWDRRLRMPQLL